MITSRKYSRLFNYFSYLTSKPKCLTWALNLIFYENRCCSNGRKQLGYFSDKVIICGSSNGSSNSFSNEEFTVLVMKNGVKRSRFTNKIVILCVLTDSPVKQNYNFFA